MLQLVSDSETYERVYKLEDEPEDKWPVFVLRKLSAGKVNSIDDQITRVREEISAGKKRPEVHVYSGTARQLKIDAALVEWRNILGTDGEQARCTTENKKKLPSEIQSWLEDEIDDTNRLKGYKEDERKN